MPNLKRAVSSQVPSSVIFALNSIYPIMSLLIKARSSRTSSWSRMVSFLCNYDSEKTVTQSKNFSYYQHTRILVIIKYFSILRARLFTRLKRTSCWSHFVSTRINSFSLLMTSQKQESSTLKELGFEELSFVDVRKDSLKNSSASTLIN